MKSVRKFLAVLMAACLFLTGSAARANAAETTTAAAPETAKASDDAAVKSAGEGKYLQDIFVAYGKTEEEAKKWLKENGWEPIKGNANAGLGKASFFDNEIAAVIGIRRTTKADEALTDLAVMNMKGGYSLPAYQELLDEKKAEIDEFIRGFIPILEEYRQNYKGEGSDLGKKRADMAYTILNKFYDGDPEGEYAVNDTGLKLGGLFLNETKQELGEEAYNALSDEEKRQHADLQQIILESSGAGLSIIEQQLATALDTADTTWLERLSALAGDGLSKNLEKYLPEVKGQDLAPSAVTQLLDQKFGDIAAMLAKDYATINIEMKWFEDYCTKNSLWPEDNESIDDYAKRSDKFFTDLKAKNESAYDEIYTRFSSDSVLYENLFEISYKGEWGATLGDFFNPANGKNYGSDDKNFLPFAAALSVGQRAAAGLLSLRGLILTGLADNEGLEYAAPSLDALFAPDKDGNVIKDLDIYTGINRAIFRNGVALTNKALMSQNMGRGEAFNEFWNPLGIVAISAYAAALVGITMTVAGGIMVAKGTVTTVTKTYSATENGWMISFAKSMAETYTKEIESAKAAQFSEEYIDSLQVVLNRYTKINNQIAENGKATETIRLHRPSIGGRALLGIGGILLIGAAVAEGVQLWQYYQRDMLPIPTMMVDEADVVTLAKDENGETVKNINFDQYVYYDAVKCNRPEVGEIADWQSGVKEYKDHNCYDVADLNCDYGQEWLAFYKNASIKKGDPILADTLTLQYGSDAAPKNATKALHFFCYDYPVDLGDTAYSFNNKQNGIYLFWNADAEAGTKIKATAAGEAGSKAAASAFSPSQIAIGAAAGILISMLGVAVFSLIRKKRKAAE